MKQHFFSEEEVYECRKPGNGVDDLLNIGEKALYFPDGMVRKKALVITKKQKLQIIKNDGKDYIGGFSPENNCEVYFPIEEKKDWERGTLEEIIYGADARDRMIAEDRDFEDVMRLASSAVYADEEAVRKAALASLRGIDPTYRIIKKEDNFFLQDICLKRDQRFYVPIPSLDSLGPKDFGYY